MQVTLNTWPISSEFLFSGSTRFVGFHDRSYDPEKSATLAGCENGLERLLLGFGDRFNGDLTDRLRCPADFAVVADTVSINWSEDFCCTLPFVARHKPSQLEMLQRQCREEASK